jgi:hypothetical protein
MQGCTSILDEFDQARALGQEPESWLMQVADELYAELECQKAKRARIIAELDRWIEFQAGKALEKN